MTRQQFMNRLRNGLVGLDAKTIDDIAADYEGHFNEGLAAGRSEGEVADALGDPERHAREIRAEAGLKRWETERNPSAAAGAVFAVFGLCAIDLLVLLPIVMWIAGVLFAFICAAVALFGVGALLMVAGPFWIMGAPVAALILTGLGLISSGVFFGSLTTLGTIGFVNALVWYGRLHMRLLKPALEPQGVAS
ncbi:MAG: DUF1700 domain-containing protein [Caulobacteraceae bacterium]